jgi:hypothetical protein
MAQEIEVLFDVAVLGKQIEQFFGSDVGGYLLQRADAEVASGVAQLKKLAHTDANGIRLAQNQVWRGESIRGWLEEAITAGRKAEAVLDDRDE